MDGRRLEAVRARPELPAELNLIVAAGGDLDKICHENRAAANAALIHLGFSKAAVRAKLLHALTNWRMATASCSASCLAEAEERKTRDMADSESIDEATPSLADVLRIGLSHRRADAFALALTCRSCRDAMGELCPRRGFLQKRFYTPWQAVSASPARMLWAFECGMTNYDLRNGVTSWSAWPRIEALRADATATLATRALARGEVSGEPR